MTDAEAEGPWTGFLDDQGLVHDRAPTRPHPSPYVGARAVSDNDLPALLGYRGPLRVGLPGGARMVRPLARDIEGHDLPVVAIDLGGPVRRTRRLLAAVDAAGLPDDTVVYVATAGPPRRSWLRAADKIAAAGHALLLPLESPDLDAWIAAALDRELRFSLRGGTVESAVGALRTTARLRGGTDDADDLVAARRWCRSWICRRVDDAIPHLDSLPS